MMFDFSHLTIIALIQGITEFLPISSSGHLVLLPAVTAFQDQGQLLDVAAHFGTLLAVVIYVWRDITKMVIGTLTFGRRERGGFLMALMVILASVPVIAVGLVVELADPAFLRFAITVAVANLIFAGWLYQADTSYPADRTIDTLSVRDALKIGVAQICALIPGTSRSGVTMTMARMCGFTRVDAARFSMMMAIPVILGATVLKSRHFFTDSADAPMSSALLVAALSCVAALLAIRFMMRWIEKADFRIFVYYRLGLGLVLLAGLATGII